MQKQYKKSILSFSDKIDPKDYLRTLDKDMFNLFNYTHALPIDDKGFFIPLASANSDAPNNSIFYSTGDSALVYRDSVAVIHPLY